MGRRWSSDRWLSVAWVAGALSLGSTVIAMGFWLFGVSPDDFDTRNFDAVLLQRQWVLAGSLLLPLLSASAAVRSMFVAPRSKIRAVAAVLALLLAAVVCWFCCSWGGLAIEHASRTALRYG